MKRLWLLVLCACDPAMASIEYAADDGQVEMATYQTPTQVSNALNDLLQRLSVVEKQRNELRTYVHAPPHGLTAYSTALRPILTPFVLDGFMRLNVLQYVIHRTVVGDTFGQIGIYRLKTPGESDNTASPTAIRAKKARFELIQISDQGTFDILDGPAGASLRSASFNPNVQLRPNRVYAIGFILSDTSNEYGTGTDSNSFYEALFGPVQSTYTLPSEVEAVLSPGALAFKLFSPHGWVSGP